MLTTADPNRYGDVWSVPSAVLHDIRRGEVDGDSSFSEALQRGYFSQYTSYTDQRFVNALIDWQLRFLQTHYDLSVEDYPPDLHELSIVPPATIVERSGRRLSPDFLRNFSYMQLLLNCVRNSTFMPSTVLEIGGGYGAFARIFKHYFPKATVWLTDIPESLHYARHYLARAFPNSTIVWLDSESGVIGDADFVLVPISEAERLNEKQFDVAINLWSFGEMPNMFVGYWMELLQVRCDTKWLFTINSFMAPITAESPRRLDHGDWLLAIDDAWHIRHFEIDPSMHRCSLVRNFPKGICLIAERVDDKAVLQEIRSSARAEAHEVYREDWVSFAVVAESSADPARPERLVSSVDDELQPERISAARVRKITDYIGHFNIEGGVEGAFFRLWNDFRVNREIASGALLVAYLNMVGKTDLGYQCTKEELLLLRRLQTLPLHSEYQVFAQLMHQPHIRYGNVTYSVQEACDQALAKKAAGEIEEAETLWLRVAAVSQHHADCWYQLALLVEQRGDPFMAAVCATHAARLSSGFQVYESAARRLRKRVFTSSFAGLMVGCKRVFGNWLSSRHITAVAGKALSAGDIAEALRLFSLGYHLEGNALVCMRGLVKVAAVSKDKLMETALRTASNNYIDTSIDRSADDQ